MVNLTRASRELFSRTPDEQFETLAELHQHCLDQKNRAARLKEPAATFIPTVRDEKLALKIDGRPAYELTDWSFSQLCGFARVAKDRPSPSQGKGVAIVRAIVGSFLA